MVKSPWTYALIGMLLLALLTGGASYWLLATNHGARWLTAELVRRSPVSLTVEQVEGRLSDAFQLSGVRIEWPAGVLTVESLRLVWRPRALLRGKLLIVELAAQGLNLQTETVSETPAEPAQPIALRWPERPAWARWLRVELRTLQLTDGAWHRPEQPPLLLERFAGGLHWTGSRLEVSALELVADQGTLNAAATADWEGPQLSLEAVAELKKMAGAPASLHLALQLEPAESAESLQGELKLTTVNAVTGSLAVTSGVKLEAENLELAPFELSQPEQKGRVTGSARLGFKAGEPQLELELAVLNLDLTEMAEQGNLLSDLSGTLVLKGWLDDYRGHLNLNNRGPSWQQAQLAGSFSGNHQQIAFSQLEAQALKGRMAGEVTVAWQPLLEVSGRLTGASLDPAILHPDWPGTVSFEAEGHWRQPASGPMQGALRGQLLDSTLRGYRLQGSVDAQLQGENLQIALLELQGPGIELSAKGALHDRLALRFEVSDLARLLPDAEGTLQGQGWLRWRDQQLSGSLSSQGNRLRYAEQRLAALKVDFLLPQDRKQASLNLALQGLRSPGLPAIDGTLQGSGLPQKHRLQAKLQLDSSNRLETVLEGGYEQGRWQGVLQQLSLQDAIGPLRLTEPVPLSLSASAVRIQNLRLQGTDGEALQASVDLRLRPFDGELEVDWQKLNLARGNLWQEVVRISGRSSGDSRLIWSERGEKRLSARVDFAGRLEQDQLSIDLDRFHSRLSWDRDGLQGNLELELGKSGRFEGSCRSAAPFALELPRQGEWQLAWQDLELQPWLRELPNNVMVEGQLSGRSQGTWAPGGWFTASGEGAIAGGRLTGTTGKGLLSFELQSALASWDWRAEELTAEIALVLADQGQLDAVLRLPLPARLPLKPNPDGPLSAQLTGRVQEKGLVALLLPGVIQESHGNLVIDLNAGGVWRQPSVSGSLKLDEAGAYLPAAGIELKDLGIRVELAGERLQVSEFVVTSGPGQLRGEGFVRLKDWRMDHYHFKISGEKFQAIDLSELQAQVDPELTFDGSSEGLRVAGQVTIREFLLRELETSSMVQVSDDVVLVGMDAELAEPKVPLPVTADIDLILGKHVLVKAAGLDARLEGRMKLRIAPGKDPTGMGRISVAEGAYSAYGTKLGIERGHLLFSGGPLREPTFDILALRTVGSVKAGVRVTGTPETPRVELYSEPPMSNNDRLAYIVLGRPAAQSGGEASLLMSAAGALLSQGESAVLQDQLKRQLGVDVLGFEAGGDDPTTSMLTIGKYLTPDLYVSYGQSLFTEANEVRVRYNLGKGWEIESKTGVESGVDLYYKIEFR